jgi:hypothetical protein
VTADADPVVHELTTEIGPDPYDARLWRLVATCRCLGFARTGVSVNRAACEAATLTIDAEHVRHMARCAAGTHAVDHRPEWLP